MSQKLKANKLTVSLLYTPLQTDFILYGSLNNAFNIIISVLDYAPPPAGQYLNVVRLICMCSGHLERYA
jgi:hypothetical protein